MRGRPVGTPVGTLLYYNAGGDEDGPEWAELPLGLHHCFGALGSSPLEAERFLSMLENEDAELYYVGQGRYMVWRQLEVRYAVCILQGG
jgi:hypothetical protein